LKYNKKHLVRYFAKEANIRVEDAENITNYFLKAFMKMLIDMKVGDVLELRGFGVFKTKLYKGRTNVRNPFTGESAVMPARRLLSFKASDIIRKEYKKI
jgi:nucleoid DNA-binding protein